MWLKVNFNSCWRLCLAQKYFKVKITFISINEEYKRKYNTIGLYFFDFELKEGVIEKPFTHGSYDKTKSEEYLNHFVFGFTHNIDQNKLTNLLKFPNEIVEDDLDEYVSGRASAYEIKCRHSSFMIGEYVVPSKCAYFRFHLKKSTDPTVFRNFSAFPEETVKMYVDGLHSIPLELGCNQAVQLLEFLLHDGKAEMYALPR